MKKFVLLLMACSITAIAVAQHELRAVVKGGHEKEPLPGANLVIAQLKKTAVADSNGLVVVTGIPAGRFRIRVSYAGLAEWSAEYVFPLPANDTIAIMLEPEDEEEAIVIQSTRSTRTIQDIPTRVEFIAGEELDEKANMKPGDIRMVLNESTGIQTQQTSATSANSSIRIQGLDGRYTQLLKDGLPLYAGFSGGLGLLQTPPLDLKQIEVIKGSSSTLYGGGAIAGLVNLVSKSPTDQQELKFHLDATSAGGWNSSGFYGKKFGRAGFTLFAARNSNRAFDPAGIGLTAIPKFERYTFNPRLFWYPGTKTQISVGVNLATEDRVGGDVDFIRKKKPAGFFETNNSDRLSTQFLFEHHLGSCSHITIKNSFNHFKRITAVPGYEFNGTQSATFTEAAYAKHGETIEWITGMNLVTDKFTEVNTTTTPSRNYEQLTIGAFLQNTWKISRGMSVETGIRGDHVKNYGFVFLPRMSALLRISPKITSRIGGGLGYKTPTIFTEESERLQYKNVLPVDDALNKLERSYGVNADLNYKTQFDDVSFSLNHLFFYTRINDPLLLTPAGNSFRFVNAEGHIDSRGMETNIKIGYSDFKLFLGYTFTDAYLHRGEAKTKNFLTPRHRVNSVLLYEVDEKWKAGLEAYYFSRQRLSDGSVGRSYWVTGFMIEKLWEKISVYINFENFLDARQTRYGSIYTGDFSNPVFKDIYAPLDGFVINGGVKLRL